MALSFKCKKIVGWNVNPFITITTKVQGAMHKQMLKALEKKLKVPPRAVKKIMKHITSSSRKMPHIPCPK